MFIITAPTRQSFQESVAMLQDAHRELAAITMSPTRTDQLGLKTGKLLSTTALRFYKSDIDFENLLSRLACRHADASYIR